ETATPATRCTTAAGDATRRTEWHTAPTTAMLTASDGEPRRRSPKPNIQIGVTTPIGPNRIQVRGRRSQTTSDGPRTANIHQSIGTSGVLISVHTSAHVNPVARIAS